MKKIISQPQVSDHIDFVLGLRHPLHDQYQKTGLIHLANSSFKEKFHFEESDFLNPIFKTILPAIIIEYPEVISTENFITDLTKLAGLIVEIVGSITKPELLNPEVTSDIHSASKIYKDLKEALSKEYPHFNVRSKKLFLWCYTVINQLVFRPLMNLLPKDDESQRKIQRLGTISEKIVIFDTLIDDIADCIKDAFLLKKFTEIARVSSEELALLKKEVSEYKNGVYKDYFEFTCKLWGEIKQGLSELLEIPSVPETFIIHVKELMETMHYSLQLNLLQKLPEDFAEMETKLSSNMMVKILFDAQLAVIKNTIHLQLPSEIQSQFDEIVEILEKSFHHANCFATHERETMEEDITNSLFKIAESYYNAQFLDWSTTHPKEPFANYLKSVPCFSEMIHSITALNPSNYGEILIKREDGLDKDRKTLLIAMNSKKEVHQNYFRFCWQEKNEHLIQKLDALKMSVDKPELIFDNKQGLKEAFEELKQVNRVFLLLYIVFSKIKGVT